MSHKLIRPKGHGTLHAEKFFSRLLRPESQSINARNKKISVAMATFNEESNLDRSLRSVKEWVDEIVIFDGLSSDKTREIAKKYGARVFKTVNPLIFHINKQKAIDRCLGNWILQLDADEVVSMELKKEIKEVIDGGSKTNLAGYWVPRKNFFLGRWLKKTGQYPDPVIRLFKRGRGRLPCRSVHEQIKIDGNVGRLKGHLLHYPFPSFSEYLNKSNRYSTLFAHEMLGKGEIPSLFGFLKAKYRLWRNFFIRDFRCKGFMDGFPGFVFSLYSGLDQIAAYVKFWELYHQRKDR